MKKFALAVSILAASVVGASAADLAPRPVYTKAPPVVAPIYDWSGFYVGVDGGGGWARKCWDIAQNGATVIAPAVAEGCSSPSGGMAGAQIGYRWQSAAWVFGLEAKGDWANFRGSTVSLFYPRSVVTNQSNVNGIGIFTGEVGWAWNNFLLYGKGGALVAADKYSGVFTATGVTFDTASETRVGGYAGIGLEFGITPNVSIAGEYGHGFMGSKTLTFTSTGAIIPAGTFSRTDNVRQDIDIFTVRLNYRFGSPVVAKY